MKELYTVDYEAYSQSETGFEDLKAAVENLATANEQQFEEIKNEKWYTRLFDNITNSKKNEKRLASQVINLNQAQAVLTEMLVRLSDRDAKVAQLVKNSYSFIKKLSENDLALQSKINYLENHFVLGIRNSYDIRELSPQSKALLNECLLKLSDIYREGDGYPSAEQQDFANGVLGFIGIESRVENIEALIGETEENDRKAILTCCLEYVFLNNFSFDNIPEDVVDFISELNIGSKTEKTIKQNIEDNFDLRGEDWLLKKYAPETFATVDMGEYFEIDVQDEEKAHEETYDDNGNMELLTKLFDSEFSGAQRPWDSSIHTFETKDYILHKDFIYNKHSHTTRDISIDVSKLGETLSIEEMFSKGSLNVKSSIDYNHNVIYLFEYHQKCETAPSLRQVSTASKIAKTAFSLSLFSPAVLIADTVAKSVSKSLQQTHSEDKNSNEKEEEEKSKFYIIDLNEAETICHEIDWNLYTHSMQSDKTNLIICSNNAVCIIDASNPHSVSFNTVSLHVNGYLHAATISDNSIYYNDDDNLLKIYDIKSEITEVTKIKCDADEMFFRNNRLYSVSNHKLDMLDEDGGDFKEVCNGLFYSFRYNDNHAIYNNNYAVYCEVNRKDWVEDIFCYDFNSGETRKIVSVSDAYSVNLHGLVGNQLYYSTSSSAVELLGLLKMFNSKSPIEYRFYRIDITKSDVRKEVRRAIRDVI